LHSKDNCKIGDRYGQLVVIGRDFEEEDRRVAHSQQRRAYYICQCDCGSRKSFSGASLRRGKTKSCGCSKHNRRQGIGAKDLTGTKFGNLTVLQRDELAEFGAGRHVKWLCKCSLCGTVKSIRSSDLRRGIVFDCGCTLSDRISERCTVNLHGAIFGYLRVIDQDISVTRGTGVHAYWNCVCELCGRHESISSSSLRSGRKIMCHNCCKKSVGETKISEILTSHNIEYLRDKSYLDCVNDRTGAPLRFDFIVNYEAGVYIIEYDGLQHFKAAPMWDDNGDLEERQRRDAIKDQWCATNNIPLIRIPYTRLNRLSIDDLCVETSKFLVA